MSNPIVFVEIDADSRLRILQTSGVRVIVVDWRVDPVAVLWPEREQFPDIMAAVGRLPLMSPGSDDPLQSALAAIRRIRSGLTVVSSGPAIPKLEESA